jgi:glycosyltransferase involved in cell wall biosynthesis
VIPNAVDLGAYASLPSGAHFRARRLNEHRGPVILFLGRLAAKKGLDMLIRSFALVVRERPDAVLVVAGPDDEGLQAQLIRLAEAEGVQGQTIFTGMLHGQEKLEALGASDVWVLSSYSDACAVAVSEALAAGLPVVVSEAVNLASDIERDGAGIVCELDATAFAAAIDGLLGDDVRRQTLGAQARRFAQRFGRAAIGRDLSDLYSEVARR